MKKNRISQVIAGVAMTATLLLTVACSSNNDDDTPQPTPTNPMEQRIKECLTPGSDERPSWTMDKSLYEQLELTMSAQVVPQKFLKVFISDDDMMCATIGGQIRAVTAAEKTDGQYYFPLVIVSNGGNEGDVLISYYCSKLKRIYKAAKGWSFSVNMIPTQGGEPLEVVFYEDIWRYMNKEENK